MWVAWTCEYMIIIAANLDDVINVLFVDSRLSVQKKPRDANVT